MKEKRHKTQEPKYKTLKQSLKTSYLVLSTLYSTLKRYLVLTTLYLVLTPAQAQTCNCTVPSGITGFANCIEVNRTDDANVCGTLRYAMTKAELNTGGTYIKFNLNGGSTSGGTITLQDKLPLLNSKVYIDGLSQPRASGKTNSPKDVNVFINIKSDTNSNAFLFEMFPGSDSSLIRGLSIYDETYRISPSSCKLYFIFYVLCNHIEISSNEVNDTKGTVVSSLSGISDLTIKDNWFGTRSQFLSSNDIYSVGTVLSLMGDHLTIHNNIITSARSVEPYDPVMQISYADHIEFSDNILGNPVSMTSPDILSGNNTKCGDNLLSFYECNNTQVIHNRILGSSSLSFVWAKNLTFQKNNIGWDPISQQMYASTGYISFYSCNTVMIGGTQADGNVFLHNRLPGVDAMLNLDSDTSTTVSGNYVGVSPTGIVNSTTSSSGIYVDAGLSCTIGGTYPNIIEMSSVGYASIAIGSINTPTYILNNLTKSTGANVPMILIHDSNPMADSMPNIASVVKNNTTSQAELSIDKLSNATIEVYLTNSAGAHSLKYLGQFAQAGSTSIQINIPFSEFLSGDNYVAITQTTLLNGTSELSDAVLVNLPFVSCSEALPPAVLKLSSPAWGQVLSATDTTLSATLSTALTAPTGAAAYKIVTQLIPLAKGTDGIPAPNFAGLKQWEGTATSTLPTGTLQASLSALAPEQDYFSKYYYVRMGLLYRHSSSSTFEDLAWSELELIELAPKAVTIPISYLSNGGDTTNQKINWTYNVTYLEDGKTAQSMSYVDGLGNVRQVQAYDNVKGIIMLAETAYSEEGGGTVQSMMAPMSLASTDVPTADTARYRVVATNMSCQKVFGYAKNFFDVIVAGQRYDFATEHFDREQYSASVGLVPAQYSTMTAQAVDESQGVGKYYSQNNPMEPYVDVASGYPYAYTVSEKEPASRPLRVSGVGTDFKINSGKEIKYAYLTASQDELARVFGYSEVKNTQTNVEKTITVDPNGTGTVTYTDLEGKVIATALVGCSKASGPLATLVEPGSSSFKFQQNLLDNDAQQAETLVKQAAATFYVGCDSTPVEIKHLFEVARWAPQGSSCEDCKFTVDVSITNRQTGQVVYHVNSEQPTSTVGGTCSSKVVINHIGSASTAYVLLLDRGQYDVLRTISPFKDPITGKTILETKIEEMEQEITTNFSTYQTQYAESKQSKDKWYVLRKEKYMDQDKALTGVEIDVPKSAAFSDYGVHNEASGDKTYTHRSTPNWPALDKSKPYRLHWDLSNFNVSGGVKSIKVTLKRSLGVTEQVLVTETRTVFTTNQDYLFDLSFVPLQDVEQLVIEEEILVSASYTGVTGSSGYTLYDLSQSSCPFPVRVHTSDPETKPITPAGCFSDRFYADEVGIGETQTARQRRTSYTWYHYPLGSSYPSMEDATESDFVSTPDVWTRPSWVPITGVIYGSCSFWGFSMDRVSESLIFPETGTYTFKMSYAGNNSHQKTFVQIDGIEQFASGVVARDFSNTTSTDLFFSVTLEAGVHSFDFKHFNHGGNVFPIPPGTPNCQDNSVFVYVKKPSSQTYEGLSANSAYFNTEGNVMQLTDLDGREKNDLLGSEDYNIDDYHLVKNLKDSSLSTAEQEVLNQFKEAYGRQNFKNIADADILAAELYEVDNYGGSEIDETAASKFLPNLYENKELSSTDKQSFHLLKVKLKEDCKLACRPMPNNTDCGTLCQEQKQSYLVALQELSDTLSLLQAKAGLFYPPSGSPAFHAMDVFNGLQFPLASHATENETLLALLGQADQELDDDVHIKWYTRLQNCIEQYDANLSAYTNFDAAACKAGCESDTVATSGRCDAALANLESCIKGQIQEVTSGMDYLTSQWTGSSFPFWEASLLKPTFSNDDRSAMGEKLYAYLMHTNTSGVYDHLTSLMNTYPAKASWQARFVDPLNGTINATCTGCRLDSLLLGSGCTLPSTLSPSYFPVLDDYPKILDSLLKPITRACKADYQKALLPPDDCAALQAEFMSDASNPDNNHAPNCASLLLNKKKFMVTSYLAQNIYGNDTAKIRAALAQVQIDHADWFGVSFSLKSFTKALALWSEELKCNQSCEDVYITSFSEYLQNLKKLRTEKIIKDYQEGCLGKLKESFGLSYPLYLYHYTLYYYDKSNALVATVPPEGVDFIDVNNSDTLVKKRSPQHRLKTTYSTNTLGQLSSSCSPDGGKSLYLYDHAGRIRFSQNAEQRKRSEGTSTSDRKTLYFSYTLYDAETSRITETGEAGYYDPIHNYDLSFSKVDGYDVANIGSYVEDLTWPNNPEIKKDVSTITYDATTLDSAVFAQQYLQGRVSKVSNANASTHFSYDVHGRVYKVLQELTPIFGELGDLSQLHAETKYKTIDYEYHPVTSQVLKVVYQKGVPAEQFMHRYFYDANDRIKSVEVSLDGIDWEPAGSYSYYTHGPLKNLTLGDKVQRMHYAYNLQGWLKAINSPLTDLDPNADGLTATSAYGKDVFGEYLHYFQNDYKRTGTNLDPTVKMAVRNETGNTFYAKVKDLYNGNIAATISRTGFSQTGTASSLPDLMAQAFSYDQLNRLLESKTEFSKRLLSASTNSGQVFGWGNMEAGKGSYSEKLSYDPNGNIKTLQRTGPTTVAIDDLSYQYDASVADPNASGSFRKADNKLLHLVETATPSSGDDIVVSQNSYSSSNPNYRYDAKGRLIQDLSKQIESITWTANDKVAVVMRTAASTKPNLFFTYDAMGRRLSKKVSYKQKLSSGSLGYRTLYVYDASGNLMASYREELTESADGFKTVQIAHKIEELYVYGASRLGSVKREQLLFNAEKKNVGNQPSEKWMLGGKNGPRRLLDINTSAFDSVSSPYASAGNNVAIAPQSEDSDPTLRFFVSQNQPVLDYVVSGTSTEIGTTATLKAEGSGASMFVTLPNTEGRDYLLLTSYRGMLYTHRLRRSGSGYTALQVNQPVYDAQGSPVSYDTSIHEVRVDALNDLSATGRNKYYIGLNKRSRIEIHELPFDALGAGRTKLLRTFKDTIIVSGQTVDFATTTDPAYAGKLWLSLGAMKITEVQDRLGFFVHRGKGTTSWTSTFGADAVFVMSENLFIGADDRATCFTYTNTGVVTSFARTVPATPGEPYGDQNHTTDLEYSGTTSYNFRRTGTGGVFNTVSTTSLGASSSNPITFGDLKAKYGTSMLYVSMVDNAGKSRVYSRDGSASPVLINEVLATTRPFPSTPMISSMTYSYVSSSAPVLSREQMYYEVGDHLGNVRAIVTGNMIASGGNVLSDRLNTSTTGWTATGTATIEEHRAKVTGTLSRTLTVVNTAVYRLSFRYQGNTNLTVNGTSTTLNSSSEVWGEYIFTAGSTSTSLSFASTGTAYLDDIRLDRIDNKAVQIVSLKDYYPFGATMKGRTYTASGGKYRYGFNGMEQDDDLGEDYTTEYRMYDAGIGRWFSMDPLAYVDEAPYNYISNNPVNRTDRLGLADDDLLAMWKSFSKKYFYELKLEGEIESAIGLQLGGDFSFFGYKDGFMLNLFSLVVFNYKFTKDLISGKSNIEGHDVSEQIKISQALEHDLSFLNIGVEGVSNTSKCDDCNLGFDLNIEEAEFHISIDKMAAPDYIESTQNGKTMRGIKYEIGSEAALVGSYKINVKLIIIPKSGVIIESIKDVAKEFKKYVKTQKSKSNNQSQKETKNNPKKTGTNKKAKIKPIMKRTRDGKKVSTGRSKTIK